MIISLILISALLSFVGIYLVRHYALKKAILDIPNDRSSHTVPTPRGAGLAMAMVFFLGTAILTFMHKIPGNLACALLIGGFLVAIIGYIDDVKSLPAKIRALCHLIAAVITVIALHGFPNLAINQWNLHLGLFGSIFAILTIVWLINLYNFMDGIDGISGVEALFVSLAAAIILWTTDSHAISLIGFLIAGISIGFLAWNWPPAKIFIGDVGSGLLGFVFAVLALESARINQTSIFFWFILLGIFIFDATFTLLYRLFKKQKIYQAHRDHAYQRLIKSGCSHLQVTSLIAIANLIILLPLAYLSFIYPYYSFWIFALTAVVFACVWWAVLKNRT